MARDFKRQNKLAVISDLNVTPLIDLAFSLLIIFMITTPVIEQYNRIDLPSQQTSQAQDPPKLDDQFITIEANGQFRWGKDAVTQGALEAKLDEVAGTEGDQPTIHIRGDRTLPYQKIMDVVNMLKARNLSKLSLDTKAELTVSGRCKKLGHRRQRGSNRVDHLQLLTVHNPDSAGSRKLQNRCMVPRAIGNVGAPLRI